MKQLTSLVVNCPVLLGPAIGFAQWEALPESAPAPADNPTTPAKVELGKMLFFDPRLCSNGTASCFTCHYASSYRLMEDIGRMQVTRANHATTATHSWRFAGVIDG